MARVDVELKRKHDLNLVWGKYSILIKRYYSPGFRFRVWGLGLWSQSLWAKVNCEKLGLGRCWGTSCMLQDAGSKINMERA